MGRAVAREVAALVVVIGVAIAICPTGEALPDPYLMGVKTFAGAEPSSHHDTGQNCPGGGPCLAIAAVGNLGDQPATNVKVGYSISPPAIIFPNGHNGWRVPIAADYISITKKAWTGCRGFAQSHAFLPPLFPSDPGKKLHACLYAELFPIEDANWSPSSNRQSCNFDILPIGPIGFPFFVGLPLSYVDEEATLEAGYPVYIDLDPAIPLTIILQVQGSISSVFPVTIDPSMLHLVLEEEVRDLVEAIPAAPPLRKREIFDLAVDWVTEFQLAKLASWFGAFEEYRIELLQSAAVTGVDQADPMDAMGEAPFTVLDDHAFEIKLKPGEGLWLGFFADLRVGAEVWFHAGVPEHPGLGVAELTFVGEGQED